MLDSDLESHYDFVIEALIDGELVPFLGAGVNLCGRPNGLDWSAAKGQFLPSGRELADYLAGKYHFPGDENNTGRPDLLRVTQYIVVDGGGARLHSDLRKIFDAEYQPTDVHRFFATLPRALREKGYDHPYQVIVTTNYDDLMEKAYGDAGVSEPYDILSYVSEQGGVFAHFSSEGKATIVDKPNEYLGVSAEKRPVIMKIHGTVDRADESRDSFVITEDDYIAYMAGADLSNRIPKVIMQKLQRSHFLFLGYSLRDWNLRVFLHRIWSQQQQWNYKSWAVQPNPSTVERKFWGPRNVDILDVEMNDYIAGLNERIAKLPCQEGD